MARETFEVYYYQNGRWQLHGSFDASQRDKAIEEGKGIDSREGFPARVVRETFSEETNTSEEIVTWQSTKAKAVPDSDSMFGKREAKAAPKPAPPKPPPPPEPRKPEQSKPKPSPPRTAGSKPRKPKGKKRRSGFVRFMLSILISLAVAIVSLITTTLLIAQLMSMGMLAAGNYTQLIIGSAVLVFFLAMFVSLQRQFDIMALLRAGGRSKAAPAAGPAQMLAAAKKKAAPVQDVEFDQVEIEDLRAKIAAEDAAADSGAETDADDDPDPPSLDADMGSDSFSGDAQVAAEPASTPAPQPPAQVVSSVPEPQPKAAEKKPAPPAKTSEKSPAEVEARGTFGSFISDAMRYAKPEPTNAFSKFGMNLYFAGGASVIGQARRLPKDAQLSLLKDGLVSAGNPAERAESFCVELPTHGKNPRYTNMVQAGASAMTQYMGGNSGATAQIGALLGEWNLPEKRPTVPSVFTFMFTDIVGSTAMTQRLGNAGAQKAVRAHNTAVRGALKIHKGREVKHTGDGIMAVFPDPVLAVKATIRMLREIAAHNSANPSTELMIRIGINVGEAVEEDNDFFGAAVQMTARICDKASKGNVWVSQAVKEACKGERIGFIPRGKFEMKGIQGTKPLYEVGWSDAHKNELADI